MWLKLEQVLVVAFAWSNCVQLSIFFPQWKIDLQHLAANSPAASRSRKTSPQNTCQETNRRKGEKIESQQDASLQTQTRRSPTKEPFSSPCSSYHHSNSNLHHLLLLSTINDIIPTKGTTAWRSLERFVKESWSDLIRLREALLVKGNGFSGSEAVRICYLMICNRQQIIKHFWEVSTLNVMILRHQRLLQLYCNRIFTFRTGHSDWGREAACRLDMQLRRSTNKVMTTIIQCDDK